MWEKYRQEIIENNKLNEDWFILGIDLGTTHSVVSYYNSITKRPEPIDISQGFGKIPMPSVVQFRNEIGPEWVVGDEAYKSMIMYPKDTITSIKRKMGSSEQIQIGDRKYLPEEISGMILKELLQHTFSLNPNCQIAGVVVSVPYDFDDSAKKATVKACQLAGLSESLICLIEEPKAAALTYYFKNTLTEGSKFMVFDFGGGTLDITVFHVSQMNSEHIHLQVISEGGDAYHGGDQIDERILDKLYTIIYDEAGLTREQLSKENKVELKQSARDIKERLSGIKKLRVPFTFCVPPFMKEMSRVQLETLIDPFIQDTRQLVLKTLTDGYSGAIHPSDIDFVLLEGGSSSMPWVKDMLISIFNDYEKIYSSDKPALNISIGATYYAAIKMGLLEHPEMMAIGKTINFEITVPHDIGFEVDYGYKKDFHTMISRGTPYLLAKKTQIFTLSGNTQEEMTNLKIKILERMRKEDKIEMCKLIGEVFIEGLPERPSGKTKLKVTLSVQEESGIVNGEIEDLGYPEMFEPSAFKASFSPNRIGKTIINAK